MESLLFHRAFYKTVQKYCKYLQPDQKKKKKRERQGKKKKTQTEFEEKIKQLEDL